MNPSPSSPENEPHSRNVFRKKRGIPFFKTKLDADGFIKLFFGGNSYLAILSLLFICLFLFRASMGFFPNYRTNIEESRLSGVEFVNLIREETAGLSALKRKIDTAYISERRARFLQEEAVLLLYQRFEALLDDQLEEQIDHYTDLEPGVEKESYQSALNALVFNTCNTLSADEISLALSPLGLEKVHHSLKKQAIEFAQLYALNDYEPPEGVALLNQTIKDGMGSFQTAHALSQKAGTDLIGLERTLTKKASRTNDLLIRQREIPKRIAAMKQGIPKIKDPAQKAEKLALAQELHDSLEEVPIDTLVQDFYTSIPAHKTLTQKLHEELKVIESSLPKSYQSSQADSLISSFRTLLPGYLEILNQKNQALLSWDHKRPVTLADSFKVFFFGSEWQTNSSWQNIYGLLPLLGGSMLISVIALCFAVPLAIGAAIYVNQFARPQEASILKPAIEFIQAIPSVVLGLFGVLVLAGFMKDISASPLLSWIPGFPIQDRLNALLAGLLLAFMAAPTIFTLAEDALNNVPKAYTEASLAMGATKLQTAIKVVVPAAMSGVLAATLLGFGRVIGETMVVLLVAGNKAKIPDLTEGLGIITNPVHTMTSIIAQECGEVEGGSVHYMALFMIGLILFVISLTINSLCQKMLNKKA